ncbi:hypothetical protein JCM8202_002188 [Rhodotorula sphaerocarpa]
MTAASSLVRSAAQLAPPQPLPDFRLAEKLGQGAFGSVYKASLALNWTTGETCAVKQIDLSHIPQGDLPEIMSEIDLLKNLHHPNIVQYRGYHQTTSSLYIVFEYCENGSLAALVRKFGRIPESLVGLYVLQVLQGLQYLHEQGVIHRDIKGSNILATKEGSIKLADFGVATRVGGPSDMAVVGSPYWMAPEIVDQFGASPASDIWSLGALVIELLTSKPPYHFLEPMPALFRIVADDGPPLPEGSSAAVRDFLGQCFQKDPNLRVGAKKLLRHPWMVAARKQAERQRVEADERRERMRAARDSPDEEGGESLTDKGSLHQNGGVGDVGGTYEEEVAKVQEFNQALKAGPAVLPNRAGGKASDPSPQDENARPAGSRSAVNEGRPDAAKVASVPSRPAAALRPSQARSRPQNPVDESAPAGEDERETSAWDSDFEEGVSQAVRQLASESLLPEAGGLPASAQGESLDDFAVEDEEDGGETGRGGSLTIRPTSSPARRPSGGQDVTIRPPGRLSSAQKTPARGKYETVEEEEEDYSDLVGDEQEEHVLHDRVKTYQNQARSKPLLLRPSDLVGPLAVHLQLQDPKSKLEAFVEEEEGAEEGWDEELLGDWEQAPTPKTLVPATPSKALPGSGQLSPGLISSRFANSPGLDDYDSDEEDPFAAVEAEELGESSSDDDFSPDVLARDQLAQQAMLAADSVEVLSLEDWRDGREGKKAVMRLIPLLESSAPARTAFVSAHGMLVALEALRTATQREHVAMLLRVVNLIVGADGGTLEKLALVGGCPTVTNFASRRYSREIRLEAALFIGAMCRTSLLTLQMFVSCQGLRILTEMLDGSYDKNKDLVWMALDGMCRVFDMEGPTPRNDVCRVLVGEGLLGPLSSALLSLCEDTDELAVSARSKAVRILLVISQSDHKVKEAIAQRRVVSRLVSAARLLDADSLVALLKTVKNVSMLPVTLEALQKAGTIEVLAQVLAMPLQGKLAAEIQTLAVNTLFNLCRLSKPRQDVAAAAGVIPLLQELVHVNSPLKQFALPILCDFAHASRACRRQLWAHDGITFYLRLLDDAFWASPALEALAAWLQEETTRVEAGLVESTAVEALARVFCGSRSAVFESLIEPVHKLARTSRAVAAQLAVQSGFTKRIVERMDRATKPITRLALLRLAKTLFDSLRYRPRDRDKVVQILSPLVLRLAENANGAVLVQELAKTLQDEFRTRRLESRRGVVRRSTSISGDVAHLAGRSPARLSPPFSPSLAHAAVQPQRLL